MTPDPVREKLIGVAARASSIYWDGDPESHSEHDRKLAEQIVDAILEAEQEPKRVEITDEMVERAARALFDESPDMLDAGWEASPEKGIYRKAATAALRAALSSEATEQRPKRIKGGVPAPSGVSAHARATRAVWDTEGWDPAPLGPCGARAAQRDRVAERIAANVLAATAREDQP